MDFHDIKPFIPIPVNSPALLTRGRKRQAPLCTLHVDGLDRDGKMVGRLDERKARKNLNLYDFLFAFKLLNF